MAKFSDQQRSSAPMSGQEVTKEQLNDVYAAGTSDGAVQLENDVITVTNEGYEEGK